MAPTRELAIQIGENLTTYSKYLDIVFSRTKHGVNKIAKDLNNVGIKAAAIHGLR